jgi:hypothetical protein
MARNLICDSFDGLHATRSLNPGFRNVVAIRTDDIGPDITSGHGMQCEACYNAQVAAASVAEVAAQSARLAAVTKLRFFGFAAGAIPLSPSELDLIFKAREKGEF